MQLLPIETLRQKSADEKKQLGIQAGKDAKKVVDVTNAHKSAFPAVGKLVCVYEEDLNELKAMKPPKIASNTSLASYWESITGTKMNNHWYSCAVAFGTFVRTELIEETDYDKNTAQCLELAASISTKVGGDITHAAIQEAADELKDRSKDSPGNLRKILERLNGPAELSAEKAKDMIVKIIAAGHLTSVVIPAIGGEIAHVEDSEIARSIYLATNTALEMFESNKVNGKPRFSAAVVGSWLKTHQQAKADAAAPVKFVKGEGSEKPQRRSSKKNQTPQPAAPAEPTVTETTPQEPAPAGDATVNVPAEPTAVAA